MHSQAESQGDSGSQLRTQLWAQLTKKLPKDGMEKKEKAKFEAHKGEKEKRVEKGGPSPEDGKKSLLQKKNYQVIKTPTKK